MCYFMIEKEKRRPAYESRFLADRQDRDEESRNEGRGGQGARRQECPRANDPVHTLSFRAFALHILIPYQVAGCLLAESEGFQHHDDADFFFRPDVFLSLLLLCGISLFQNSHELVARYGLLGHQASGQLVELPSIPMILT